MIFNHPSDLPVYMSFGGGVQSTAIAMLAITRDPRLLEVTGGCVPQLYLFADTGDESERTYAHVWDIANKIDASGSRLIAVARENGVRCLISPLRTLRKC